MHVCIYEVHDDAVMPQLMQLVPGAVSCALSQRAVCRGVHITAHDVIKVDGEVCVAVTFAEVQPGCSYLNSHVVCPMCLIVLVAKYLCMYIYMSIANNLSIARDV